MMPFHFNFFAKTELWALFEIGLMLTIKSTILLTMAYILSIRCRKSSAAVRHFVWCVAFFAICLLPFLNALIPSWHIVQIPTTTVLDLNSQIMNRPSLAADKPEQPRSVIDRDNSSPVNVLGVSLMKSTEPYDADDATRLSKALNRFLPTISVENIIAVVFLIWAFGVMALMGRQIVGRVKWSHLERGSEEIDNFAWNNLCRKCRQRFGIARPVQLFRSEKIITPMTLGVLWPKIFLPSSVEQWPWQHKHSVLIHELAHVKRWDAFSQFIAQIVVTGMWFNPLVWLAYNQLIRERELACDDIVLNNNIKASEYANLLLNVARSMDKSPMPIFASVSMAHSSQLEGRLLAILNGVTRRRRTSVVIFWALAFPFIATVFPIAAMSPVLGPSKESGQLSTTNSAQSDFRAEMNFSVKFSPKNSQIGSKYFTRQVDTTQVLESLIVSARDASPEVRRQAIKSLAKIDDPKTVEILMQVCRDNDPRVREKAVEKLAKTQDQRCVDTLINALRDHDNDVRLQAIEGLENFRLKKSVEALCGLLKDEDWKVRQQALESLGALKDQSAFHALVTALHDKHWKVRREAAQSLGDIRDKRAVSALCGVLSDSDSKIREDAAKALAKISDPTAVDALLSCLGDEDEDVRENVLEALGTIKNPKAIAGLEKSLFDNEDDVREHAAKGLLNLEHSSAIEVLIRNLQTGDRVVKVSILEASEDVRSDQSMELIKLAMDDHDWHIRKKAVEALGEFTDSAAIDALRLALTDVHEQVRKEAVKSLGEIVE